MGLFKYGIVLIQVISILMVDQSSAYVYKTSQSISSKSWENVQDLGFSRISVGLDDAAWAITAGQELYRNTDGKRWARIPGSLSDISAINANVAWGVSPNNIIYRYQNGQWFVINGKLTTVSAAVHDEYVQNVEHIWGISPSNTLWYCYYQRTTRGCAWKNINKPNQLRVMAVASAGDGTAFALFDVRDATGYVMYRWNGQSWSLIDERLVQIQATSNRRIIGVNALGEVRKFNLDDNTWTTINSFSSTRSFFAAAGVNAWILSRKQLDGDNGGGGGGYSGGGGGGGSGGGKGASYGSETDVTYETVYETIDG